MNKNDWDLEELRQRLALAHAKLARHERLIGIILGSLIALALLIVGLVAGDVIGVPVKRTEEWTSWAN